MDVDMNKEKAIELIEACLDEMYKVSTPPITLKQIFKKYGGTKIQFYLKHAITIKDYNRIKNKYYKKIDKVYHKSFEMTLLGYSPTIEE